MEAKIRHALLAFTATACLFVPVVAHGQPYAIDWYKVAAGGGSSSGGSYTLSGTFGQHDAGGPMTGGSLSLTGGFWNIAAVQMPGAPTLSIARTGPETVVLSWPVSSALFSLQQCTDLASPNWTDVANSVTTVNGTNQVTISPVVGSRFFRLTDVPPLTIVRTGPETVVLSWPVSSVPFSLQECTDLASPNWTAVTNAVTNANGTNQVTINPATGFPFFRLVSQVQ